METPDLPAPAKLSSAVAQPCEGTSRGARWLSATLSKPLADIILNPNTYERFATRAAALSPQRCEGSTVVHPLLKGWAQIIATVQLSTEQQQQSNG